jgi:hypothetical protein
MMRSILNINNQILKSISYVISKIMKLVKRSRHMERFNK